MLTRSCACLSFLAASDLWHHLGWADKSRGAPLTFTGGGSTLRLQQATAVSWCGSVSVDGQPRVGWGWRPRRGHQVHDRGADFAVDGPHRQDLLLGPLGPVVRWVSVRTRARRTSGEGTGGSPTNRVGWPREAHSASYTASTARPTSRTTRLARGRRARRARRREPGCRPRRRSPAGGHRQRGLHRPPAALHPADLQLGARSSSTASCPFSWARISSALGGGIGRSTLRRHQPRSRPPLSLWPPAPSCGVLGSTGREPSRRAMSVSHDSSITPFPPRYHVPLQNAASNLDLRVYGITHATRWYSLITPPSTFRRGQRHDDARRPSSGTAMRVNARRAWATSFTLAG